MTSVPPTRWLLLAAVLVPCAPLGAQERADRLYGRVTTAAGDVLEGWIRWDRNEASWADVLDGYRALPREDVEREVRDGDPPPGSRERTVELFGVRVTWNEDDEPGSARSGVRFGYLSRLRVLDDEGALLTFKDGREVELTGGSTDLGAGIRGIEVQRPDGDRVQLRWRDLDAVDFGPPPPGLVRSDGVPAARLHGTVEDRWGRRYTGWVTWDLDEALASDELDGRENGRDRVVPFSDVASIERLGPARARVVLHDGRELVLEGTNDVDRSNRGIQVSDPGLGQVSLGWRGFRSVHFHPPEESLGYDAFEEVRRLRGTVWTEDGRTLRGRIRWDHDEAWSWELLDGQDRDVEVAVELGRVARIEKRSSASSSVTLRDGRVLELEGSNDVGRGNKGVFVESDEGEVTVVAWRDFRVLELAWD